jgi:GMP synthase-like glutamine amidotransferase
LKNLKGFIIPGSSVNINDDQDWIRNLIAFIKMIHEEYQNVKMVGTCFGHCAIAHALGGKTERMEKGA